MTKKDIYSALALHGSVHGTGLHLSKSSIDKAVDEIYAGLQKELGKAAKKNSVEYADPLGSYHQDVELNFRMQQYIEMRKRIRKPITKNAIDLLMKRFKDGGFTRAECKEALMVACSSETMGVFPKKKFKRPEQAVPDRSTIDYSEGLPINKKQK
jgi:hypothetical protein